MRDAACALELYHVLQTVLLECGVVKIKYRVGAHILRVSRSGRRSDYVALFPRTIFPLRDDLFADESVPAILVIGGNRLAHDLGEVGTGLDADDVQYVALGLHEEGFDCRVGV